MDIKLVDRKPLQMQIKIYSLFAQIRKVGENHESYRFNLFFS